MMIALRSFIRSPLDWLCIDSPSSERERGVDDVVLDATQSLGQPASQSNRQTDRRMYEPVLMHIRSCKRTLPAHSLARSLTQIHCSAKPVEFPNLFNFDFHISPSEKEEDCQFRKVVNTFNGSLYLDPSCCLSFSIFLTLNRIVVSYSIPRRARLHIHTILVATLDDNKLQQPSNWQDQIGSSRFNYKTTWNLLS